MTSSVLCTVILLVCAVKFSTAQTSCKGRCGIEYYRGYMCQCDYSCLSYGECCKDYESQCTTKNSCKGRCGETFKRGRLCSCDNDCMKYKQCCSDYKIHCDAEDDDLMSLDSPTSYPTDDLSDDTIFPNDEFSNNEVEDLVASPVPESTSGYEPSTADLLAQVSTEPTLDTDIQEFTTENFMDSSEPTLATDPLEFTTETVTVFFEAETTTSDYSNLFTVQSTTVETPAENTDASDPGTTHPQPTAAAADHNSNQPSSASVPQMGPTTSSKTPEVETLGQVEIQSTEVSFPSHESEVTFVPFNTQDAVTVLENSQDTATRPLTPDLTTIPEETTSNPNTENYLGDVTADPEDASTGSRNSTVLDDAVMTHISSSTAAIPDDTTDAVTPGVTTPNLLKLTPKPTGPQTSEPTSKPQDKPDPAKPLPAKPTSKPESKPVDTAQTLTVDDPRDYQGDDSNDTNLCSGRPVSAVTTLRNGTIVVFRGHYFWFLDANRVPGPPRGITQVWGVPSPIDTVFTRCNCQGKTYIFKGGRYWRFENDVLDPGYPRAVQTGFDGLQGHITAALSVPQYQRRKESVYFFKRGGFVQKYSYQFGTSPSCNRKVVVYNVHNRMVRQAVSVLGPSINIRTSWRGFPSTITAAVSIPSNSEPEGYKYYVFSRSKSYSVRMDVERPVITAPKANTSPQTNDVFKCPKKV